MAPTVQAAQAKMMRLTQRLNTSMVTLAKEEHTVREVANELQLLERAVERVEIYRSFNGTNEEPFDYDETVLPTVEEAQDCLILLRNLLRELEDVQNVEARIAAALADVKPTIGGEPVAQNSAIQTQRFSGVRVTIPIFKGEPEDYPKFRETFLTAMRVDGRSKPEQLRVLEQHMEGRPLRLLRHIRPTDAGFDEALEILDDNFGDPERQKASIMKQIRDLPTASDDVHAIRDTYETLEGLLRALNEYRPIENDNELFLIVMSKYASTTLDRVMLTDCEDLATLRSRVKGVLRRKEKIETVTNFALPSRYSPLVSISAHTVNENPKKHAGYLSAPSSTTPKTFTTGSPKKQAEQYKPKCRFCFDENHASEDCPKYKTSTERVDNLGQLHCHKCLRKGHRRKFCMKRTKCKFCDSDQHHPALCPKMFGWFKINSQRTESVQPMTKTLEEVSTATKTTVALVRNTTQCYLTAACAIRNPQTKEIVRGRVFSDSGCPKTFVLHRTAKELALRPLGQEKLAISVFMRPEVSELTSDVVALELLNPKTHEGHLIRARTVPRITNEIATLNAVHFMRQYPQIKSFEMADEANDEEIVILLGNDFLWSFILPETRIQLDTHLYILNTIFGHMIVGSHEHELTGAASIRSFHVSTKLLEAIWSLDALGITDKNLSQEEEERLAIEQFNITLRHLPAENRYEVGLPFRELHPNVPTNFAISKAILFALVRKYADHPEYLKVCDQIFREQLEQKIIEPVDNVCEQRSHYIPYKWIERPGKSTPIRIVYNASAKTRKGASLNESLYKGVNLLGDLIGILIRVRLHHCAIVADIAKAFHQITIIPNHRDYLRFLWLREPEKGERSALVTYRFRRLPFGVISSPFILAATILYHLNKYRGGTAARIRRDIYADNIVTSFRNEFDAKEFYTDAMKMFDAAGMPLRQWQSNVATIRDQIPVNYRDKNDNTTVLGLKWDTQNDTMSLNPPDLHEFNDHPTMLQVLQISAKFYDPLGWFTPITISSRMFLQQLHSNRYEWSTTLTVNEAQTWAEIRRQHERTNEFEFVRSFTAPGEEIQALELHVFSDASIKAYGCAAYLRIESAEGVHTHLLTAKSKVTPLKSDNALSIPRLELMGVLLAARMLHTLNTVFAHTAISDRYIWCDSKCVLAWLRTNAALPAFVRNRISEIRKLADVKFRYIPSAENPADLASRGTTAEVLHEPGTIWWHGPPWLKTASENWPLHEDFDDHCDDEQNVDSVLLAATKAETQTLFDINITNYNDYRKLIRVSAKVIEFLSSFTRVKRSNFFGNRSSTELATFHWIRLTQREAFTDVINDLKKGKSSALIKKFALFMDDTGLLRLRGRFHYAPLTFQQKHPILLPKASEYPFVRLLVLETHRRRLHAPVATTLSELRLLYWPIQGRKQVAAVIRQCRPCKRNNALCYEQPTDATLPAIRLDSSAHPFSHIGLDVAGHFWIRSQKKWVLLITCLVSRAVLLEDLDSMDTETLLLALERAEAKTRGFRSYLSDNAPQFVRLSEFLKSRNTSQVDWRFIPAHMPWAGGAYERLVGVMKSSLYATLREEVNVSEPHFRTILQKLTNVLNDRPLTYLSEEFDGQALTPNHILQRSFSMDVFTSQQIDGSVVAEFLRRQTNISNEIVSKFWNRWSTEYLNFLRERASTSKFRLRTHPFEPRIGDVVIIEDEVRKRRIWHLARVIQRQRSADNRVRAAVVQLGTGTKLVRPVEKLYFLELNEFEDQGEPVPTADDGSTVNPRDIANITI